MRFMMIMYPGPTDEKDWAPSAEAVAVRGAARADGWVIEVDRAIEVRPVVER